jgi:hypothetical protein
MPPHQFSAINNDNRLAITFVLLRALQNLEAAFRSPKKYLSIQEVVPIVGGQPILEGAGEPQWSPQIRPMVVTPKPANGT